MATIVTMPDLGFDAKEGILAQWLVAVGDAVTPGQVIAEIESDKVNLELEAQNGGRVEELVAKPGDVVQVGARVAVIADPQEQPLESQPQPEADLAPIPPTQTTQSVLPGVRNLRPASNRDPRIATEVQTVSQEIPHATPIARRMADQHGVPIAQISGTGPGGRVLKADVERHLATGSYLETERLTAATSAHPKVPTDPAASQAPAAPRLLATGNRSVSPLRRAIGQRMLASKTSIPHFYITIAVEMDAALELRKQINAALSEQEKVTVNDMVVRAVALALRAEPALNASFQNEEIVQHDDVHVGTAVAVDGGLLTVVMRHADRATVSTIAAQNRAMIQRARNGRVKPDDVGGASLTVSNLGSLGIEHFAPIIDPPQAAILGVATARPVPVAAGSQVVVRTMMNMTVAADHR